MSESVTPAAAFELLAAEPRMDIMQALVDARREGETPLSFSALRRRTGIDDSGRFNYHLGKLVDTFVEKGADGYGLSYAGSAIVAAVIAGAYTGSERKGPVDVEGACELCGADLAAEYVDGDLSVRCENDHGLFVTRFPPGAAASMEMETLLEVSTLRIYQRLELAATGRCAECFGPVETNQTTQPLEDSEMHVYRMECTRCGGEWRASAGSFLTFAPEVVSFFRRRGVDIHHAPPWTLIEGEREATVVSEEPYRLQFDLAAGDDRIRVVLDETGQVAETAIPD
ncbi:DUF7351 domain-containing protein [Halorarius halobius]|uniref:DUF7351 domain-containing protein n=1 Tax=Halorarius halobius TaxID=2962671 RepID=UPI0020CE7442|nr:hypothetical protein [Halorarius halobius]